MTERVAEHRIRVQKTARYYTLYPPEGVDTKVLLFAIHGYRQMGRGFLRRFEGLENDGVAIIVPEAPHRFYLQGASGKVGASWMTKEAREDDIADYVHYMKSLKESVWDNRTPIAVLGFSQGGPTACRWLSEDVEGVTKLILHSTVFPNDFDFEAGQAWLQQIHTTTVFGDTDEFADEKMIAKKMDWITSKGVESDLVRFKGGHQIHFDSVQRLLVD